MSRIDQLVAELCPEGVEFKEIHELFVTKNGYTPSTTNKAYWTDGTVPWFRMEDIRENGRILGESSQQITEEAIKGGRLFPANSIIVATSATIGEHALITVPHLSNQRFTSLALKPDFVERLDMKFIFYYCFVLDAWCRSNTTTSSFASVDMNGFKRFRFPVPPIKIQCEIVNVLDTFTKLEAELEAELEARRRQYQHYRDALLSFDERMSGASKIRWATLGEIAHFINAKPHEKLVSPDGDIALMTSRFISTEGKLARFVRKEDVLTLALKNDVALVMSDLPNGKALAKTFFVDKDNCYAANQRVCLLRVRDLYVYSPRFLHYVVNRNKQLLAYDSGVDQTHLKKDWIVSINLPVPPLEEQARIVAILDKFDALVNDLSRGLPAEIKARRQQYEHYRDRLLTFREVA